MTPLDPACGYSDGDVDTNDTTTPSLETLADNRFSRRQTIMGGAKATGMALMGTAMLAACDDDDTGSDAGIIVNAGTNAATSAGRVVTLTGTVVAGSASSTTWTQTDGADVALTLDGTTATFLAPAVEEATDLEFTFIATTSDGIERKAVTYVRVSPAVLGFTAVEHSLADTVVVPTGYSVTVMTRLGDPLTAATSAYANDGTDTDFANRIGDHADALHYFGLSAAGAPDDPTVNEHLGDALWSAGRRYEARYAWNAAALFAEGDVAERLAAKTREGLKPEYAAP